MNNCKTQRSWVCQQARASQHVTCSSVDAMCDIRSTTVHKIAGTQISSTQGATTRQAICNRHQLLALQHRLAYPHTQQLQQKANTYACSARSCRSG